MLGRSIGKTDNYLIDKIKIIVPNEIKQFLKDTLFFSQNQKILEQQFVEKIEEQERESLAQQERGFQINLELQIPMFRCRFRE